MTIEKSGSIWLNGIFLKFLFICLLLSCKESRNKVHSDKETNIIKDSLSEIKKETIITYPKTGTLYERTPDELKAFKAKQNIERLISIKTLKIALRIANHKKTKQHFELYNDTFSIVYGNVFSKDIKHLIIRRHLYGNQFTDIYKLCGDQFVKGITNNAQLNSFVNDSIRDVNGDDRSDYLIHTYSGAGCCLRDVYDVYLQKTNGDFTKAIWFMNPVFYPKEKIIRGLCYGQMPPYYKFKWKGFNVDTIEYIFLPKGPQITWNGKENITTYPDSMAATHYIRRKSWDENTKGEYLETLPKEYYKVETVVDKD